VSPIARAYHRRMRWLVVVGMCLAACSSQTDLHCTGATCTCPADSSCTLDPEVCGPTGCTFTCGAGSTCTGRCGDLCNVSCERDSSCGISVARGGMIACAAHTDCDVTCAQDCVATCAAGSHCTIRCATDVAQRVFTDTASCL